jgi:uncharacterized protein (DUF1778 family)
MARANRIVRQHRDVILSNDAFDRFSAELDAPAVPIRELIHLFESHPKLKEG